MRPKQRKAERQQMGKTYKWSHNAVVRASHLVWTVSWLRHHSEFSWSSLHCVQWPHPPNVVVLGSNMTKKTPKKTPHLLFPLFVIWLKKNVFKNPLQSLPVLLRHTNLHPCRLPFGSWIRFFRCSRLGLCPSESPAPSPGLAEKPLRIRKLDTMPHLLWHNNRTLKLYLDFVWVSNNAQRLVNVGSLRGILD